MGIVGNLKKGIIITIIIINNNNKNKTKNNSSYFIAQKEIVLSTRADWLKIYKQTMSTVMKVGKIKPVQPGCNNVVACSVSLLQPLSIRLLLQPLIGRNPDKSMVFQ